MAKIENVILKVVGVTFGNEDGTSRQEIISNMTKNAPIILKREPDNKFDTNAIAVYSIDGQVGYIGREYAKILAPLIDSGVKLVATVNEVDRYKDTNYLHIAINEE